MQIVLSHTVAELIQSRHDPTRWLKADTITVTLTVTDIYCVNIIKKQFYWRAV